MPSLEGVLSLPLYCDLNVMSNIKEPEADPIWGIVLLFYLMMLYLLGYLH